jgi:hypothetical protein
LLKLVSTFLVLTILLASCTPSGVHEQVIITPTFEPTQTPTQANVIKSECMNTPFQMDLYGTNIIHWGVSPEWYNELLAGESTRKQYQLDRGLTVKRDIEVTRALYTNYYTESPCEFISHGTWFGSEELSVSELLFSGEVMRQQMERGWVLVASGKYGYHWDMKEEVDKYMEKYASNRDAEDYILDSQGSVLYSYYADGGIERTNYLVGGKINPVTYEELNDRQKRIYDITKYSHYQILTQVLVPIEKQAAMTPEEALASGTYVGFVSGKSVNDIGRRYLLYRYNKNGIGDFVGVVLVVGTAKRADWTGVGAVSDSSFKYDAYPLILRTFLDDCPELRRGVEAYEEPCGNVYLWGFDFASNLFAYFGGGLEAGNPLHKPTDPVYALDPDL